MSAHFILATAGHVDHGKSSLVKALTGIDPDRLPEEKARGITIDLGFAHLTVPAASLGGQSYDVGIVDVPGHEDFVKNMVAGVGSIDVALLVVAADDGWMPQTEEHFQILNYLGVTRAVVALSKADLPGINVQLCSEAVRSQLQNTAWADAPIVPTALSDEASMAALKAALGQVLATTPPPPDIGKPRLPIDRVFTLRGIGTVVTGTLSGGILRRGQTVVLQPSGATARIRTLQNHGREVDLAGPGTRTALALAESTSGENGAASGAPLVLERGRVVTLPGTGSASSTLDVSIERSGRTGGGPIRALRTEAQIRMHHGTGNVGGRLVLVGAKELGPGEKSVAQLRLDAPWFAFAGDRFIIRDSSEQITLAGGLVLDVHGDRRRLRGQEQRAFLEQRAQSPNNLSVWVETTLKRDRATLLRELLVQSHFRAEEIARAGADLCDAGKTVIAADYLLDGAAWKEALRVIASAVDGFHLQHPNERGLPLPQVRTLVPARFDKPELVVALLHELAAQGFQRDATVLKRISHCQALPPQLQAAGAALRRILASKGLEPPNRRELAPSSAEQQALRFLIQTGEVVDLGPDLVLPADRYSAAVEAVKSQLRVKSKATVSDLRQALNASRRIVVPLLEKLDREGVTRRDGDFRVLKGTPDR